MKMNETYLTRNATENMAIHTTNKYTAIFKHNGANGHGKRNGRILPRTQMERTS